MYGATFPTRPNTAGACSLKSLLSASPAASSSINSRPKTATAAMAAAASDTDIRGDKHADTAIDLSMLQKAVFRAHAHPLDAQDKQSKPRKMDKTGKFGLDGLDLAPHAHVHSQHVNSLTARDYAQNYDYLDHQPFRPSSAVPELIGRHVGLNYPDDLEHAHFHGHGNGHLHGAGHGLGNGHVHVHGPETHMGHSNLQDPTVHPHVFGHKHDHGHRHGHGYGHDHGGGHSSGLSHGQGHVHGHGHTK